MKKTAVIALTFVLIASLFTGCRRNVTPETSAPTKEPTRPATQPTTSATTPSTTATTPSTTDTTPSGTTGSNESSGKMGDGMIDGIGDAGRGRRPSRLP